MTLLILSFLLGALFVGTAWMLRAGYLASKRRSATEQARIQMGWGGA